LLYLPDVRLTILRRRMDVSCWLDNMDGRRLELEVLLYIESNVLVGELGVELVVVVGLVVELVVGRVVVGRVVVGELVGVVVVELVVELVGELVV